jgi:hypothetical protein
MASFKVPKHAFDSDELAVLDQAFESAWAAIRTHYPRGIPELDGELRSHLSRLIFRIAAHGVNDVQTLRDFALTARSPYLLAEARRVGSDKSNQYARPHRARWRGDLD